LDSGATAFAAALDSAADFAAGAGVGFDSLFTSERDDDDVSAGVVGAGATGAGTTVESFFSAVLSPSGLSLGDFSEGIAVDGLVGVLGDCIVVAVRGSGGGFIQSSTYGTATAPTTPRTITTRTTRNQVAAKIDRGGTSSYSSCS
jgi:hypothetical protein